jgi:ubiquinone/menaquinone biosynthesis C-methylase UbiE
MEQWVNNILVDPVTKLPKKLTNFKKIENLVDARVYLKNTYGWKDWKLGQKFYESWLENGELSFLNKETDFETSKRLEKSIYDKLKLKGKILDVGGGVGTLRDFLKSNDKYLCIDPHYKSLKKIPIKKKIIYKSLEQEFNFIVAFAEFLPIKNESFDYVHMRSMLDHVQIPDLVIIEAFRVLKNNGKLIVGLTVEGGKTGKIGLNERLKNFVRQTLYYTGIKSARDYHTWHPTLKNLRKLIKENGFEIKKSIWQSGMNNKVVYIQAIKSPIC